MAAILLGEVGTVAVMKITFPPCVFETVGAFRVMRHDGPLHIDLEYGGRVWIRLKDQEIGPALTRQMRDTLWRVDERIFFCFGKAGNFIRLVIPARYVVHGKGVVQLGPIKSQVEVGLASGAVGTGLIVWPEVIVHVEGNRIFSDLFECAGNVAF